MKKVISGTLLAILALVISQAAAFLLSRPFHQPIVQQVIMGLLYLATCLFLVQILSRSYFQKDLSFLLGHRRRLQPIWLLVGILLPTGVLLFYLLIGASIHFNQDIAIGDSLVNAILLGGGAVAFAEELVFRGFLQTLFQEHFGKWTACWLPSLIFAALHLLNGNLTLGTALLLLVAGTSVGSMFALVRIESHSLLNSWILHAIWNTITSLVALDTSSNTEALARLIIPSSNPLLTGGHYGIDIGLPAIGGYLLVAGLVWRNILI
ncbi:CPBP family intramembrane glutamic endopeptidase [Streptococcus acidominimus]|uniref:CAAX amino terminal protease self- immunity n=1 Tax=Streptococcus acidominimus TaxID=1326 RepID=A0A1Q8EDE0_STRAI|nr:type II CAAX endopeptidase family protein [Streptococcus acidominimus]OLF49836.1 hypothetical protein BU200_05300 [Streptococcus acidominimus]SUN08146.1 CAAX amino terminal protease self- immunity [Streptococcus acidominimus]